MIRPSRAIAAFAIAAVLLLIGSACSSRTKDDAASATVDSATDSARPAASQRRNGPSEGCTRSPPAPPGTTDERISSRGIERSYQLIVPDGYDGTTPLPIVFGMHSLTVDYRIVPGMSGLGDMATTYDFIGVAPSGLLSNGGLPFWNAAPTEDNYDLVFLTELLDHLEDTLCIDTGRIFSVGMSNGAQISSLLACRLGDRIAAIAPIAGVEYNEPCDGPPVPIIAFHGVEDPIVPYAGGGLDSVRIADVNFYKGSIPAGTATPTGVDQSMQHWAEHNGCDPEPVEDRVAPEVRKRAWQTCDAPTELYIVDNGGHTWPGKPQPAFEAQFGRGTTEIDATALLFQFFFDGQP